MVKRDREEPEHTGSNKRLRHEPRDRFSALSDELLLVLLSYLTVQDLTRCEHRLRLLASDSQIWKSAYYDRFVRPRAARIPGIREANALNKSLLYSSKLSKWLEDGPLVKRGGATNWKRQYKLRHNWSRGSCKRTETEIAERPSIPPLLVRLHDGIIITADANAGLRAWSTRGGESHIASMAWNICTHSSAAPSSLAVDSAGSTAVDASQSTKEDLRISVGFLDGSFGLYALDRRKRSLKYQYLHAPSTNGSISAIAFAYPYLLTMTEAQLLSLYRFPTTNEEPSDQEKLDPPRLLSSLKSHTAWPPLSLAIRCSSAGVSTSIAYAMPTYTAGWSVGMQELRLSTEGTILESRLATPFSHGFRPLDTTESHAASSSPNSTPPSADKTSLRLTSPSAKPTSLSYTHPYLLAAYSDNTMTLYMVTSNARELFIGPGKPLCGHTSSVLGAHVGDRGKAVSVSAGGSDLRVWELEAGLSSNSSRRRAVWAEASVMVRPENRAETVSGQKSPHPITSNLTAATVAREEVMTSKGWLSFDEEQVVLLGEKSQGSQALIVTVSTSPSEIIRQLNINSLTSCIQAATAPIRPATAQSAAPQHATTAARKVTSAANAAPPKKKNHVIAAVKWATSHANVPIPPEELRPEAWVADSVPGEEVEEEARNATNAARSVTSLAIALKVVLEATEVEVLDMAEVPVGTVEVGMELGARSRLAILAAGMDTCLATAPRDRNATIVEKWAI
ncbi:MAG: hypothetical protein Q9169_003876 [Polycauliona sp. 2 TL-2023]